MRRKPKRRRNRKRVRQGAKTVIQRWIEWDWNRRRRTARPAIWPVVSIGIADFEYVRIGQFPLFARPRCIGYISALA